MRVGQNYEPRRDAIVRVAPSVAVATAFRTRGYLGVTFDGPSMDQNSSGERVIRFLQYPRIALVDAGSPAERGGVIQGDTLLAFNGTDVRDNEISLTRLLVPDTKIVMRVRRDGGSRDLKVTVGETPGYYTWRGVPAPAVAAVPPMPVAPDGRPSRVKTTGEVIVVPAPSVWRYEEGFGGAQVATISDGLGKALGVNEGVLVIHALPGTPAYRSGLRDGDIIQSVAGRSVVSVRGLQRILAESDGAVGVKLTVLKERKQTEITLRW
jgi:S1-C subfamily serine protease